MIGDEQYKFLAKLLEFQARLEDRVARLESSACSECRRNMALDGLREADLRLDERRPKKKKSRRNRT